MSARRMGGSRVLRDVDRRRLRSTATSDLPGSWFAIVEHTPLSPGGGAGSRTFSATLIHPPDVLLRPPITYGARVAATVALTF